MLHHAAQAGAFDLKAGVMEALHSMRRAGKGNANLVHFSVSVMGEGIVCVCVHAIMWECGGECMCVCACMCECMCVCVCKCMCMYVRLCVCEP